MNEEHTHTLFTDFDRLFRGRTEPGTQTRMCEGFACEDGWFDLVYQLCAQIMERALIAGLDPKVTQVKQKFGALRFYADGIDATIEEMIEQAERLSETICEVCGLPGKGINGDGWNRTLCPNCAGKPVK